MKVSRCGAGIAAISNGSQHFSFFDKLPALYFLQVKVGIIGCPGIVKRPKPYCLPPNASICNCRYNSGRNGYNRCSLLAKISMPSCLRLPPSRAAPQKLPMDDFFPETGKTNLELIEDGGGSLTGKMEGRAFIYPEVKPASTNSKTNATKFFIIV
jgi:hypothetical protein